MINYTQFSLLICVSFTVSIDISTQYNMTRMCGSKILGKRNTHILVTITQLLCLFTLGSCHMPNVAEDYFRRGDRVSDRVPE